MERINPIFPEAASRQAKEHFDSIQKNLGMIPNMRRTRAQSPAVLGISISAVPIAAVASRPNYGSRSLWRRRDGIIENSGSLKTSNMEKGETMMKRTIGKIGSLTAALMLLTSLVGCAASQTQPQLSKVKCPACGYEFSTAAEGGG